jgi:DNA polymerase III subunit epsilon
MIVLCYDTETTGLISNHILPLDKQPEVIEFACALVNLKVHKTISTFESMIKPSNYPMNDYTIRDTKTKLSNELLAKAPTFAKVANAIKLRLEQAPLVLAHNASFDREMMDLEFERLGQTLVWPRTICTVEQTSHLKGKRMTLSDLHQTLLGKEFDDAHRAGPDVQALVRVAVALFQKGLL